MKIIARIGDTKAIHLYEVTTDQYPDCEDVGIVVRANNPSQAKEIAKARGYDVRAIQKVTCNG